jgi:hypothetical protein
MEDPMWLAWVAVGSWGSDVLSERAHVELEVGFYGGDRSLGRAPFEIVDEDGRKIAGLDGAFNEYPLRNAIVAGPRTEFRIVAPPLRAAVGGQVVFPRWDELPPEVPEHDSEGVPVITSIRGARMHDVVLAVGLEAPTGVLVPFVDLVGTVHLTQVALEVSGQPATFQSRSFSMGGRGGLRLQFDEHAFLQGAGEYTPFGPSRWGATVGVGVAL